MGVEREVKYQVLDQTLFRRLNAMDHLGDFALEHAGVIDIVTMYLDTQDLALFRSQYALRLRFVGDRVLLSLKGPSSSVDAIQVRPETEISAPGFSEKHVPGAAEVVRLMPSAAELLRGLSLSPVLHVADRRALHYVLQDGAHAYEIACDTVTFSSPRAPGQRAGETELEIEQKGGSLEGLQSLMHIFELFFALTPRRSSSKYQDGLRGLGII